jgi:hypothetical protein
MVLSLPIVSTIKEAKSNSKRPIGDCILDPEAVSPRLTLLTFNILLQRKTSRRD